MPRNSLLATRCVFFANSSAGRVSPFMADAQKIDAARALVARIHDVVANVVDYDGNGFCWGWSTIGSAHPHALQHGAVVEVGHVDASVGVCATLNDMCLERWARRHVYDCRSHDRYSTLVNAASCANMAENNFYNHGNKKQPDVLRAGGFCGPISIAILADQLGLDYVVGGHFRRANRHE